MAGVLKLSKVNVKLPSAFMAHGTSSCLYGFIRFGGFFYHRFTPALTKTSCSIDFHPLKNKGAMIHALQIQASPPS